MFCKDGWKLFGLFFVVSIIVFGWSGAAPILLSNFNGDLTGNTVNSGSSTVGSTVSGNQPSTESLNVFLILGWNLVSVPYKTTVITGCDSDEDSVWAIHYDSIKKNYDRWIAREEFTDSLIPGKGYWIYYESDSSNGCTLSLSGSSNPLENNNHVMFNNLGDNSDGALSPGANMIGATGESIKLSDYKGDCVLDQNSLMWYDPNKIILNPDGSFAIDDEGNILKGQYAYSQDLSLIPGKGYWINNKKGNAQGCMLKIQNKKLHCYFDNTCLPDDICVLKTNGLEDAHAELCTENNYENKLCCGIDAANHLRSDSGQNSVIYLSASTDSHASKESDEIFTKAIYLEPTTGVISCDYISRNDRTVSQTMIDSNYDACLASIYPNQNGHIGDCSDQNAYDTLILCKYTN